MPGALKMQRRIWTAYSAVRGDHSGNTKKNSADSY